ncbi:M1 family metallopeptidase [Nocardiopsis coralliicola]
MRRIRSRVAAPLALALASPLALAAGWPAQPAAAGTAPGGAGDPYFPDYGNAGYDVAHYDLDLDFAPGSGKLTGTAEISATAEEDLPSFTLDFLLQVDAVRVDGEPAGFTLHPDRHKLEVVPQQAPESGDRVRIEVDYADVPADVQWGGQDAGSGWYARPGAALALGQPESAWWWFPSNDHPSDKATYDVRIAVPEGTEAIATGVRTSRTDRGGKTVTTWRQDRPAATYLATFVAGDFAVETGSVPSGTAAGRPLLDAYATDLGPIEADARASIERSTEVVEFLEQRYGPYPFNALGGVVESPETGLGFALETQSRPVYSPAFFDKGTPNPYVVVHELAHQWWGDSVSVAGWNDIWLNEGFATYAEWEWSEHTGEGTAQEIAEQTYAGYPADDAFWTVPPGDPGAEDVLHTAVYNRGALAVHALRTELGDADFDRLRRTWLAERAYGNGSVQEFQDLAEQTAGRDLSELFTTWLYSPERPAAAPGAREHTSAAAPPESWPLLEHNREVRAEDGHGGRPGHSH